MSKVLVALVASMFVLLSATVLADDKTPSDQPTEALPVPIQGGFGAPGGWAEDKARKDAQKKAKQAMTPEEKKAMRAKRQKQLEIESRQGAEKGMVGDFGSSGGWPDDKARWDARERERQKALTDQSKKGPGQ